MSEKTQADVGLLVDDNPAQYDGLLLAQNENSDVYDPFVDYSEFEQASEEEADINFFRNGRFFTLGFAGGYRMFTSNLGKMYTHSPYYGLFLAFFFDLRFAMQLSFSTGDHTIDFSSPLGTPVRGTVAISDLGLSLKYYLNTQNVTKGLAQLNPYLIGGLHAISRTATLTGEQAFGKETANALSFGGGMEIPLLRNKMYLGGQFEYFLVSFADENSEIILGGGSENTGLFPSGDIMTFTLVLGVNF